MRVEYEQLFEPLYFQHPFEDLVLRREPTKREFLSEDEKVFARFSGEKEYQPRTNKMITDCFLQPIFITEAEYYTF